jgi:hypothetical protein
MSMNVADIQINVQKGLMIEHLILKNCIMCVFSGVQWNVTFLCAIMGMGRKLIIKKIFVSNI